eukprot:1466724-Rhodomonas_salina.1
MGLLLILFPGQSTCAYAYLHACAIADMRAWCDQTTFATTYAIEPSPSVSGYQVSKLAAPGVFIAMRVLT